MDCLFCKIAKKDIPAAVIYEDEKTMAVLDVRPRAPGHTMVIPKNHAENILDLEEKNVGPMFLTVKKLTAILNEVVRPDGFTIGINQGRASGQAINHLHIHIIPRFNNDKGGSIHSVVNNPPKESLEEIARRIKIFMKKGQKKFEEALKRLRKALETELEGIPEVKDMGSDIDAFDTETDETEEFSNNLGVREILKTRLRAVKKALDKLESNAYGKCEKCGAEIPKKVLEVNPESEYCADCKIKSSQGS